MRSPDIAVQPSAGLVRSALAAAAVVIFFTGLDNYAFLAWSAPPPVYAVLAFVGAAAALVVLNVRRPIRCLGSPAILWVAAYFLATTLWALWLRTGPVVEQVLYDRYRSITLLVAFTILFDDARARRIALWTVACAVVFGSVLNWAELFDAVRFGETVPGRVIGRAGGLYINANDSAFAIVAGVAILVTTLPSRWRAPLLLVGLAGVVPTFSRGAMLCLGVLIASAAWRNQISLRPFAVGVAAVALVLFFIAPDAATLESRGVLNPNTMSRLRLEADDSGRRDVALKAWDLFLGAPLTGAGLGATTDWDADASSHNVYLNLAGDQGIVGLMTFPALVVALIACGSTVLPFALVLATAGMFSHGLLDDRAWLLVIALAICAPRLRARAPKAAALTITDDAWERARHVAR